MLFQRFRQIGRAVEHVHRYRTIVSVFLKYGYEDLAHRVPLPSALKLPFGKLRREQAATAAFPSPSASAAPSRTSAPPS